MAKKPIPTPDVLRQLLRYEPDTGNLFWRERGPEFFADGVQSAVWRARRWNSRYAGKEAFTASVDGYRKGCVFAVYLYAHPVIWAIMTGSYPGAFIDHVNGERSDNRFSNLREATGSQNQMNAWKRPRKDGQPATSEFKGVSWHSGSGKWEVRIKTARRVTHLGLFNTEEEAARAYDAAAKKQHGAFARFNFDNIMKGP